MNKTILGISSHIDDNIMFAGTVMKLQERGYDYYEVLLTNSAGGSSSEMNKTGQEMSELRRAEMEKASSFLNIKKIFWINQESETLQYSKYLMLQVVKIIREVKPEIGFSINAKDVHPDHVEAAKITKEAFRWAAKDGHVELGSSHRASQVLFAEGTLPVEPCLLVDITKYFQKKEELFKLYSSQASAKDITLLKSFAQIRGYHLRKKMSDYAEAFTVEQNILPILFE